jgi:hypothetical protein
VPQETLTFKTRVKLFWDWFVEHAADFQQRIEAGDGPGLEPEVSAAINKWLPGFAYVFGPRDQGGHTFTLSPSGNIDLRFLATYWLDQAPELENWTFYASRQPGLCDGFGIRIEDHEFGADDVLIEFEVNQEEEVLDIVIWHPNYIEDDDVNSQVAFIFLDEVMGEIGTEMWIGNIELGGEKPEKGIPLKSLATEVVAAAAMHDWEKQAPDKTYIGYSVPEPKEGYPRSDTIAGATCHFPLVGEFMEQEGLLDNDPLAGTGAHFLYLSIDAEDFPEDEEVEVRAKIEEQLNDVLIERAAGRILGGATGYAKAYIDLVIFDGQDSLDLIEQSMQLQNYAASYRVERFFATQTA